MIANEDKQKVLNLENTLYVPDLRNNLISVSKETDKGYEVTFRQHDAVIQDNSKYKKVFAKRVDDLYYTQENSEIASVVSEENNSSTLEIWHKELGHLDYKDLKKLLTELEISFNKR